MRQQVKKLLLTTSVALLIAPISAYAHPGRTDANGGHTCRTNCEKWGLQYGEYHYHNKPASSSGATSPAPSQNNNGAVEAEKQRAAEAQRKAEEERQRVAEEQRKAEKARKQEEAKRQVDMEKGQLEGEKNGETDFKAGKNDVQVHLAGKSDTYKQAFTTAYTTTWSLEEQKKTHFEKGKEQGLAQETMDDSQITPDFKQIFAEGFQVGNKERTEKIEKEQAELGEKAGKELAEKNPGNNEKDVYVKSYETAYEKGYKSTKKAVEKAGYKYAFENYDLKIPAKYEKNGSLKKWFTEGFKSNKKATEIREEGFKKGDSWFSFFYKSFVPSEYKEHKELYEQAIEKGKKA
ncbi:YHYH domain-containing protein [Bacillus toyonensis]|uniref:YHYH domain-containing protein n=1 Tax=Bacillus toyonensis TaxID=155322 RepID=UPI001F0D38F4|nr:YHYH domain-containing protein [Bacillus toyonensis]MCH5454230.1 YHYH domain-containing protein [Bacillus toyonensis]HDR7469889.1 YHYH domain-containing protein [Bacillus toyonensis]